MILTVVKFAVLAYGGLLVVFWAAQERLLFHPSATIWQTPADFGQPYREVSVATADGLPLSAWYVPPPMTGSAEAPVIWYLSGNGGNRASWAKVLAAAARRGYGVFVCDWRGYGGNPGAPSEAGFLTDAAAAWKTLTQDLNIPPGRILIWGKSLGGTIAAQTTAAILSGGERPLGLVLDCTFADLMNVARSHYPWLPVATLSRHAFDATPALTAIGRAGLPVLIVHGQQDEVVHIREGRAIARLLEAAGAKPAFVERPGGHNLDLWLEGGHAAAAAASVLDGWARGLAKEEAPPAA